MRIQFDALFFQQRLEFGHRGFEILRDRMRVRAQLALHHHEDARRTVDRGGTDRGRGALRDFCNIADAHCPAVAIGQHGAGNIRDRVRLHIDLQQDVLVRCFHKTGTGHAGCPARRDDHLFQRHTVAMQFFRVNLDLPLAHVTAEYIDFRDATHRQQMRANRPVDQRAQLHQAALVGRNADAEDRACR